MTGSTTSWRAQAGFILSFSACCGVLLPGIYFASKPSKTAQALPTVRVMPAQDASLAHEPLQPLSAPLNLDPAQVRLGRALFHDVRLSADSSVSCASCHDLQTGGVDRRNTSEGIYHRRGTRNAPTVFNAGMNYRQFWDGRAATLEAQVDGPLQAEAEMGSTWESVILKLRQDTHYAAEFSRLYPEGIQPATVRSALAAFERSLVTTACRFDRYLQGEKGALSTTERAGYRLFVSLGCVSCHQGRNIGGGMMQPLGVMQSPYAAGQGRGESARREQENLPQTLYKVPGLRNVARTAPYFHDGSIETLPKAIRIMSDAQLCRHLTDEEVRQIVAFLQSLTGTYEGQPL